MIKAYFTDIRYGQCEAFITRVRGKQIHQNFVRGGVSTEAILLEGLDNVTVLDYISIPLCGYFYAPDMLNVQFFMTIPKRMVYFK